MGLPGRMVSLTNVLMRHVAVPLQSCEIVHQVETTSYPVTGRPSGGTSDPPPSISASATSTSSVLAAQCSGVSDGGSPTVTFGSAPAAMSTRTTSGALAK
jgi:hypothetical protein